MENPNVWKRKFFAVLSGKNIVANMPKRRLIAAAQPKMAVTVSQRYEP
jgi:hypothetical protein